MTAMATDVPDSIRPHLNEIAERLWTDRAAIMVGAGFSKNAGHEFPDWNQLGDIFYQKAHGVKPDAVQKSFLNVLRLAEEVQAAIGRPALEQLLQANIPDLSIEPSLLHVELLELPWVDVFTTNYDTLLERASAKVVTRRYEPVVNSEDIPYALKPRILKLHGSFPSERPFIITEEDYRRYPKDYAPFVNTVQQALLENTFCLIGFSGDDPNFLKWIGWIRDNLGSDKTQKIYLVGVFDLSPARLQLLAQRGIIVVDLSCFNGIGKHDHKKALNKFIEYVRLKKPDALDWPYHPKKTYPTHDADRIKEIQDVTKEWREQRQAYPGWLILPHSNRENLWACTRSWIGFLPDIEQSPIGLDIKYTFELIWRLERCLLPIFNDLANYCEQLLERYWPFKINKLHTTGHYRLGEESSTGLSLIDVRQAWLFIALAMLRFYREEGEFEKWKRTEEQLNGLIAELSAEQRELFNYEGFLFSIFTLDVLSAKQRLAEWSPSEAQPYWMAKRAAALAEIGVFNELDSQIQLSLVNSRKNSRSKTGSPTYQAVSNEAYQMLLLRYVRDASNAIIFKKATPYEEQLIKDNLLNDWKIRNSQQEINRQDSNTLKSLTEFNSPDADWNDLYSKRFSERKSDWNQRLRIIQNTQEKTELQQQNIRWDELKAFRCDPWNELKLFELALSNQQIKKKDVTEKREYDIGRVTRTHHFSHTSQEDLNAYSFLRFCEEVGLPFRVGSYTMATKTALASLQRISQYSLFWAIATLTRLGDTKAVDTLFNRETVYKITSKKSDQLIQSYLDALSKSRDDIHEGNSFRNDNYGVRLAQLLPEIISRFCCKCSSEIKYKVIEFITELYASPDKINYRNISNLTKRLINSMTEAEQYRLIPSLLKIPFPEDLNTIVKDDFLNPFLFLELKQKPQCEPDLEIQPRLLDSLLQHIELENPDRRRWAITSLVTLHKLNMLDEDQKERLAEIIWSVVDQYGLPDDTDFYKFAFLRFPSPGNINPSQLFKNYVTATPFPIQNNKQDSSVSMTGGRITLVHEIIGASADGENIWNAEDALRILERLIEWWDADKSRLSEEDRAPTSFSSIQNEFRSRFSRMVELIAEVVGPNLTAAAPSESKASLDRLLQELREYKLPALEAEAACIHIYRSNEADVYNRINDALTSNKDSIERDGLRAISRIIIGKIEINPNESELISTFIQYVTWCPTHSIVSAFWVAIRILKYKPANFPASLGLAIQRRLDRLIIETSYDQDSLFLSFDEKLEVHRISSIMAATLWVYYNSRNLPIPESVEKWREICTVTDEFSEIKNAWGGCLQC